MRIETTSVLEIAKCTNFYAENQTQRLRS
jgi:hypothetical protein